MGIVCDWLVVAGGGGGGGDVGAVWGGGGGGGGGVQAGTSDFQYSFSFDCYPGAGGIGGDGGRGGEGYGKKGGNSAIFYITNWVEGGGGGSGSDPEFQYGSGGQTGGCGGGNSAGGGGVGSATWGYPGGHAATSGAGGGGGMSSAGAVGTASVGGLGGAGFLNYIQTGAGQYYGAGGGGGSDGGLNAAGGSGVGGTGGIANQNGGAAVAYTGSGGGGAGGGTSPHGGGGGSAGVIIIRYAGPQVCTGGTVVSSGGWTVHTFTSNGVFTTPAPPPPPPVISSLDYTTYRRGIVNAYSHVYGTGLVVGTYGVFTPATGCSAPFAAHGGDTLIALHFNVAADAPLGNRTFQVQNQNGTSNGVTVTIIPLAPTITGIDNTTLPAGNDAVVVQGTTNAYVHIWGTDLIPVNTVPTTTVSGTGVTTQFYTWDSVGNLIAVHFTTAADAPLGQRTVTVTTDGGVSNALTITVIPPPPTLTELSPAQGPRAVVHVDVLGTNFVNGGTTLNAGPDITVGQFYWASSGHIAWDITIAPSAAPGPRTFTVTTAGGTTNGLTFTVLGGGGGQPSAMII